MALSLRRALLSSALFVLPFGPALAAPGPDPVAETEEDTQAQDKTEIVVTGSVATQSSSATGLTLSPRETPQSVTIVDRQRIEDFQLTNVNDLLNQVVGINVERVETDRTYFNSRGFDITNFQVDGIGLPLIWGIQFGDLDTALFDSVEAIRGANAIMSGVGNPSATINYVRKRPTDTLRASASAQFGSWDQKRFEADISGPISDTVSARLIFAHEDRDSWLDYNHVDRNVFGALVSWKVTPDLTATAGYSRQENKADGVLWGALPLLYTDGTRIDYPVSASTSADWTFWNVTDQSVFAELNYQFGGGWSAKGVFTYKRFEELSKLLYAYGYPDKATGLGVGGMTGIYPSTYDQYLGDFYASGPVKLFGREHQLAFGVSTARSDALEWEDFYLGAIDFPAVQDWGTQQVAEPDYPGEYLAADYTDRLTRAYGAAHLNFSDQLKAVVGASAMWIKSTGTSYGTDQSRKESGVSPYIGAVYDVTPHLSLYASYTGIFNPQSEIDVNNRKLDPAKGTSIEAGIKSDWFGGRLYATASLFRAKQKGLAAFVGVLPNGDSYYEGEDTTSKGFEMELAGRITPNWTLSGGYTGLKIENEAGEPTRTFLPTKSLKLATTYTLPQLNDLRFGAQLRWQNQISAVDSDVQGYGVVTGDVTVTQKSYAVADLMAGVRLLDRLRATVNVRNVGNAKYLGSLMWGQAYYAAPRSANVTLSFAY
ncbi:outer membrane receptor for ferric coprogen and ferric-rhodotorulic acid [Sphingomonas naasensis]|uniref:TonB-dependent siderophore receptor n=1 Tax=Sphingomonas naasensis TaxID=1344951 RepID=A0A4S1WQR1_9SPHN|nr:TonB-dependent siderophore receptor [Sphingomonas naasensis]NIJ20355.1 outer membrane receptor for ferric coprogen and ferric-rhodotorulic acid [Sphingomonas naasensis]TGX44467.1 TonB-dependent siderophore receptor [Sphingomonas naasensis]